MVRKAFIRTLESSTSIYLLLALPFILGAWVALGLWEIAGPLALISVVSSPIILLVSLYPVVLLWSDTGVIGRSFIVASFVLCALLVCYGILGDGHSLLRWGGIAIVFTIAVAATLQVSIVFIVAPLFALIVRLVAPIYRRLRLSRQRVEDTVGAPPGRISETNRQEGAKPANQLTPAGSGPSARRR